VPGPFVHHIDPVIGTVAGVHLWWYGLSYTLGFLNMHAYFVRRRAALGLSTRAVYGLSTLTALGVLLGGRLLVVFYERAYFGAHPLMIPALWMGGMATHGLILGGVAGVAAFCVLDRQSFLRMLDALAIPAALIMGLGRIGNFIDGEIVGSVTTVPWGVWFPDAEGFRHPVVLYDGLKNLLIVPVLLWVRRRGHPPGGLAVRFIILYAAFRIPIDLLREYPTTWLSLPTGQTMNVLLTLAGLGLLLKNRRRPIEGPSVPPAGVVRGPTAQPAWWQRVALALLVVAPLVIPSDGIRDVPVRYAARHPGLRHSALYPPISLPGRGR